MEGRGSPLMRFVVDASIAAAWLLPDEQSGLTDRTLRDLAGSEASVPSLFWHEICNLMLVAERRGRLSADEVQLCMAQLRRLPLVDAGHGGDRAVMHLAKTHSLTAYDAVYLALALSEGLPLATTDKALAAAAKKEGISVKGPLGDRP